MKYSVIRSHEVHHKMPHVDPRMQLQDFSRAVLAQTRVGIWCLEIVRKKVW